MKVLKGFFVIFVCLLLGNLIKQVINFPIPDSVYGMVFLLLALLKGRVKVDDIKDTCDLLSGNLALFFVVPGVALIKNMGQLKEIFLPFLIIVIVSTFVVMAVTSKTVSIIQEKRDKKNV